MNKNAAVGIVLFLGALTCSAPAYATATAFDCDVPPDHFSSVSQDVAGPLAIKGSVQVVQMRSGNNLPVAGARLVSSDGNNSVGFQLVAASASAKQFDVVLNVKRGSNLKRSTVAQMATDASVPFKLSLDDTGKATLAIGGNNFSANFMPLSSGKQMVFCSTGQFQFTGLFFSPNDEVGAVGAK